MPANGRRDLIRRLKVKFVLTKQDSCDDYEKDDSTDWKSQAKWTEDIG